MLINVMSKRGDRFILILIVTFLFVLAGSINARQKAGAEVVVQKIEGTKVEGELLKVKENSLVVHQMDSGGISIPIAEIAKIRVIKKTKWGKGLLWGMVAGAGTGAFIAYSNPEPEGFRGASGAKILGLAFGVMGAGLGSIISLADGIDSHYALAGKPQTYINRIMEKLKKKARFKN